MKLTVTVELLGITEMVSREVDLEMLDLYAKETARRALSQALDTAENIASGLLEDPSGKAAIRALKFEEVNHENRN